MKKTKILLFLLVIGMMILTNLNLKSQCALSQLLLSQGYKVTNLGDKSFQSMVGVQVPIYGKSGDLVFTSPLTAGSLLTNIPDLDLLGVDIYPNPVIDLLWVKVDKGELHDLQIMDVTGKIIFKEQYSEKPVNLSHLQPGLYYLQLRSGQSQRSYKVIKI
jgi:hypothetical protein